MPLFLEKFGKNLDYFQVTKGFFKFFPFLSSQIKLQAPIHHTPLNLYLKKAF
jgi:hypothetical protein